jgi:predicted nucleotidyltransferase
MTEPKKATALRAIPPSMDPETVAAIDVRLDGIAREHGVSIPLAIESGSRAWGFPSPDSDYDCRFVFVRPPEHYMTLFPLRDVIETPLTEVFDVNGWDIAKALKLLLSGNAVIVEWLTSPIIYRADAAFRDSFLELAGMTADRTRIAQHYLHLGRRILSTRLGDLDDMPIKKLFYALRPAIALRWMRAHPEARLPPMHFPTLCAQAALQPDLNACIEDLLARKAVTRELGRGPMPQLIRSAILSEFDEAEAAFFQRCTRETEDEERADAFFRDWVKRYAPLSAS